MSEQRTRERDTGEAPGPPDPDAAEAGGPDDDAPFGLTALGAEVLALLRERDGRHSRAGDGT